jgi:hypothetical protein
MHGPGIASLLDEAEEVVLVGDVHGQGSTLRALLGALGWRRDGSAWSGPSGARLLFIGDLIDRGPQNALTLGTVRSLVEQGQAVCLMGNHEYNALLYHTEDPESPGEFLRARIEKNERQHAAVIKEIGGEPALVEEMRRWFHTLPLAIETARFRAVHACWPGCTALSRFEVADGGWFLPQDVPSLAAASRKGSPHYSAIQTILKGPEEPLPQGVSFRDKDGTQRFKSRTRWWLPRPGTWGEALLLPDEVPLSLREARFQRSHGHAYFEAEPPVFFGHYWMHGEPGPLAPNAACLDYSAGNGGPLVAYRFRGETTLRRENFVVQPPVEAASPGA